MSRSLIPLTLSLFAVALLAVPAALAKSGPHRVVRGVCTQESTSKLKLSREDRGIEVEFEVDQNRNGVPWNVTLRRNGHRIASFRATTHAPSGSFEIRRVLAAKPGSSIVARATRSGETCTASGAAPRAGATGTASQAGSGADDAAGHDAGDDHGND
ncbi:MAG: hypothetical protein ACJ75L_07210 [Gaiellaceae bacterium]